MAFNSNPGRAPYTATAGQTVFPFVFKIYLDGDIKVYLTPVGQTANDVLDLLTLTTDYTVSVNGDDGGDVTLLVGASMGDKITLVRDLDINRLIEYQNNGDLLAETLNQDQNYQTYLIADKDAENETHLRLPDSVQGVSTELPAPIAINFLQWDATATALQNVNSLQADGFIWTATEVYTQTETNALLDLKVNITDLDEDAKLWDKQTTTINFATDADLTLTTEQEKYGKIILTDTGVVLTTARNVIVSTKQKDFIIHNDTLQALTVKTLAGTGIIVGAGGTTWLLCDGVNVLESVDSGAGGKVLQQVNFSTGTVATGTTAIPDDNSIPQNTEGDQYMSLAITPLSATSKLKIEVATMFATTSGDTITIALFQDAIVGALGAIGMRNPTASILQSFPLNKVVNSVDTTTKTFKVRIGGVLGTTTFNGALGGQIYGGVAASSITITETEV